MNINDVFDELRERKAKMKKFEIKASDAKLKAKEEHIKIRELTIWLYARTTGKDRDNVEHLDL